MTIAISLKVHEGLVLAADSAATVMAQAPDGAPFVVNVYNNANKVFNLLKGSPIGASTWGAGAIGKSSIATLMKDLRRRFSGEDESYRNWRIDPKSYSMSDIADKVRQFIFEENYEPFFSDWKEKPDLGLFVVGYSSRASLAEEYQITIQGGNCAPPLLLRDQDSSGMTWNGQTEAITRLVLGFSPMLPDILASNFGILPQNQPAIGQVLMTTLNANFIQEAMPLQDAIDLVAFLADVAAKYSQFAPGASVVGGPIEIAAISKHEGFKWVQRKYYFESQLNPSIPDIDRETFKASSIPAARKAAPSKVGATKKVASTTHKSTQTKRRKV